MARMPRSRRGPRQIGGEHDGVFGRPDLLDRHGEELLAGIAVVTQGSLVHLDELQRRRRRRPTSGADDAANSIRKSSWDFRSAASGSLRRVMSWAKAWKRHGIGVSGSPKGEFDRERWPVAVLRHELKTPSEQRLFARWRPTRPARDGCRSRVAIVFGQDQFLALAADRVAARSIRRSPRLANSSRSRSRYRRSRCTRHWLSRGSYATAPRSAAGNLGHRQMVCAHAEEADDEQCGQRGEHCEAVLVGRPDEARCQAQADGGLAGGQARGHPGRDHPPREVPGHREIVSGDEDITQGECRSPSGEVHQRWWPPRPARRSGGGDAPARARRRTRGGTSTSRGTRSPRRRSEATTAAAPRRGTVRATTGHTAVAITMAKTKRVTGSDHSYRTRAKMAARPEAALGFTSCTSAPALSGKRNDLAGTEELSGNCAAGGCALPPHLAKRRHPPATPGSSSR